ncbi:MAG TPA: FAD-dependent monooxygenase [Flavobacterium sp.]|jgi:anthraniloyl-CoA monooxygenase
MKITVIGGGPGGLYFSILLKKAVPNSQIDLYERNKSDDAFGFGVVFSDETLSEFLTRDPKSYELIRSEFAYWDDLDVARDGDIVRITGNGFCGCSRKTLLQLLQQRCTEEGVKLHFESDVDDLSQFSGSDYIIACDGINSQVREKYSAEFGTKIKLQRNKFVWLGTTKPLDAFTYFFRSTPHGAFVAHSYQYQQGMSTMIFECTPETWKSAGFETTNEQTTIHKIQQIFKEELGGHQLISNKSHWRQFPTVTNGKWHHDNIVLLGDAKATAHYSIGSGTKLAMECAIALADSIAEFGTDREKAFANYEQLRRNRVETIQHAANVSLDWFENMDRHMKHDFMQFAFGVMTRAKKVTFENLALRDKSFIQKVLTEFNCSIGNFKVNVPAAFTPFRLREMVVRNRIVMSPMGQYSAEDGVVSDWHLVHYGSRATAGVGLIIAEMTSVSETGRITLGDASIYTEEQTVAWKKITEFVHKNTKSKMGIQLGHSGRKGAINVPSAGSNIPLEENGWDLISASALPFAAHNPVPREMTEADMDEIVAQFILATKNADAAGFDMIELQAHHGYLLASFLSPLTNVRTDEFGGGIDNRIKFPLRVFTAMRSVFNLYKPMSVRISASDWAENGISDEDVLKISKAFHEAGADIINVSTGNTVSDQTMQVGRMWQTPFSDIVRNTLDIPTITTGAISDVDQINTILLNGRADLVGVGKPFLLDPGFVRHAQAHEQYEPDDIPNQYIQGKAHLYPRYAAERKEKQAMKKALKPETHKKR